MTWMNRFDIEEAYEYYDGRSIMLPNYFAAASILHELMDWTDQNSDGWPYWQKPSRAASRLMDHLSGWRRRHIDNRREDGADLTVDELDAALKPIKAFLTRTANAHPSSSHAGTALQLRAYIVEMA